MNPQCGYYQGGQSSSGRQTYGYRTGARGSNSSMKCTAPSTYGGCCGPCRPRAPPTFGPPCGNVQASAFPQQNPHTTYGYQQQYSNGNGNRMTVRPRQSRQSVGRSSQYAPSKYNNVQVSPMQQQLPPCPTGPSPPKYCTPQAIKVNVTAEQLQNAKNSPIFPDRGEPSQEGNGSMKYIQLNWQDLLGGMENLRVCMQPSADPNNPNRQLKVSFGGQRTDPPQAGETPLKVLSIQPAGTSERLDLGDGNAFAGTMKVCNPPPCNMRMGPAAQSPAAYRQATRGMYRGTCRQ